MGGKRDVDDVCRKYIRVVRMIIRERKVMRREGEGFEAGGVGILLFVWRFSLRSLQLSIVISSHLATRQKVENTPRTKTPV